MSFARLGLAVLLSAAVSLQAQEVARYCDADDMVGRLGITHFRCANCFFEDGLLRFVTAPEIVSIEAGSPSGLVLEPGDALVEVDNDPIDSRSASQALFHPRIGSDVNLRVLRAGTTREFTIPVVRGCAGQDFSTMYYAGPAPRVPGLSESSHPDVISGDDSFQFEGQIGAISVQISGGAAQVSLYEGSDVMVIRVGEVEVRLKASPG